MFGTERIADGLMRTRGADVNIAFRMSGSGPAVVLLHGTSANHAVWQPVSESLADAATVISLDQRGHGRSDKPSSGYGGADFAQDVVTVLDALGHKHALVVGHSLGARNAWLTGALHADRIVGVLCVDYTPFVESAVLDDLAVRVAAGYRAFVDVDSIEVYLRERYPRILPGAISRRARWGYRAAENGWLPYADPDAMKQLINGFRTPWNEEFRAVRAPMTHVRGERSAILSAAAWDAARAVRPHDRWVVVKDADHYVPEERPDVITAEILHLLDQPSIS